MPRKGVNTSTGPEATEESNQKNSNSKVGDTKKAVRKKVATMVASDNMPDSREVQSNELVDEYLSFLKKLKQSKMNDEKQYTNRWAELDDHPERVNCNDLNNFYMKLFRGGYYSENLDACPELGSDEDEDSEYFCGNYSNLFRNGSWNDYYKAVDEATIELEINKEDLARMITKKNFETLEEMDQGLIPLYLHLRKKGYSHRDLVG